jgi:hypothetical protein
MTPAEHSDWLLKQLGEGMANGGGVLKYSSLRNVKRMADGGDVNQIESESKPIRFNPIAQRQRMNGTDISNAGVGANVDLGDVGRLSGSAMATSMARDKENRQMQALNLNYGNRFGDVDVDVGVNKPLDRFMPKDFVGTNLVGSMPLGEGRISAGIHGSRANGEHRVGARSFGYNTPLAGGHLGVNINKPVGAPAGFQAQYSKSFSEGGKSEMKETPRNKYYGTASDLLKDFHEFASKPFGYENPPAEFLSEFVGIPAASRVLNKKSYGESITNMDKANVPLIPDDTFDAFGALLGGLGATSKAGKLAKSAIKGRATGGSIIQHTTLRNRKPNQRVR